jgi:hypothetical protein
VADAVIRVGVVLDGRARAAMRRAWPWLGIGLLVGGLAVAVVSGPAAQAATCEEQRAAWRLAIQCEPEPPADCGQLAADRDALHQWQRSDGWRSLSPADRQALWAEAEAELARRAALCAGGGR